MAHSLVRASAPGRVNLIGEHTDYNGGFVLPTAIPQQTHVELTRRDDRAVEVRSANQSKAGAFILGQERQRGDWIDYVQGLTAALRLTGFDLSRNSLIRDGLTRFDMADDEVREWLNLI